MSRFNVYSVDDALCLSHCRSLSLSQAFVHPRTHPLTNHSPTHSFYFSPSYFISLSFSLVCTCVRARMSLSPSFSRFRPCILSKAFCLSLLFSFTHTRAHAVTCFFSSTHSQMHTRTKSLSPSFLLTHTHFSLFLCLTFLSLPLSLFLFFFSFSLSLSLSLLHTYTDTHTHSHSHTLSLIHSLLHSFIVVACARCVVFSARTRERSLLSISLPLPPFLILFLCNSVSFALFLPSCSLAFLPSFSHSFASSLFQLLVAMISI